MTPPIEPRPPTPAEWQQYLMAARAALHANPQDQEALQAIRDATAALNLPEEEAMAAGENVGESGFGKLGPALEGLGQSAVDVPVGMWRLAKGLATHPIQTFTHDLPQSFVDIGKGFASGDPKRIARSTGNVGSLLLPFAKVTRGGPSLGAVAGRATTALPRAVAALIERPGMLNKLTEARTGAAEASRGASAARQTAIESRTAQQAALQPTRMAQMAVRLQALEQLVARGPATAENLMLRNEILRLRLEMMQEGGGISGEAPIGESQGPFRGTPARPIGEETPPFEESAASEANQQAMIRRIAQHMLEQSRTGRLANRQLPLLPPGGE